MTVVDALAAEFGAPADLAVLLVAGLDFPDEEEAYLAETKHRGWTADVVVGNDTYAVLRAGTHIPPGATTGPFYTAGPTDDEGV